VKLPEWLFWEPLDDDWGAEPWKRPMHTILLIALVMAVWLALAIVTVLVLAFVTRRNTEALDRGVGYRVREDLNRSGERNASSPPHLSAQHR
jgi:hypothetical protein